MLVREAAGDRFDDIELCNSILAVAVTDDRAAACRSIAEAWGIPSDVVLGSPYFAVGRVDEIVGQLLRDRERYGFSYCTVPADAARDFATVVASVRASEGKRSGI
jgi:hypothetical protein